VNAASGRSVMGWFSARQRGTAMGVRQTSVPLGAAFAALTLPVTAQRFGLAAAMLGLASACFLAAVAAAVWVREAPERRESRTTTASAPGSVLRDARAWRLAGAASLLVVCQFTLVAFMVEVLHGHRGLSIAAASFVFAVAQVLGGAGRLAVGYWSDRVGHRVRPLRSVAAGAALLAPVLGLAVDGPVELLVVVLVAEASLVICWNGLAFTAAAEQAPPGRAGTALGFQNTASYVSAGLTPVLAGVVIAAYGYGVAFSLLALPAAAAAWLLSPLAAADRPGGLAPGGWQNEDCG
jgi:sugar phosphate permease